MVAARPASAAAAVAVGRGPARGAGVGAAGGAAGAVAAAAGAGVGDAGRPPGVWSGVHLVCQRRLFGCLLQQTKGFLPLAAGGRTLCILRSPQLGDPARSLATPYDYWLHLILIPSPPNHWLPPDTLNSERRPPRSIPQLAVRCVCACGTLQYSQYCNDCSSLVLKLSPTQRRVLDYSLSPTEAFSLRGW